MLCGTKDPAKMTTPYGPVGLLADFKGRPFVTCLDCDKLLRAEMDRMVKERSGGSVTTTEALTLLLNNRKK